MTNVKIIQFRPQYTNKVIKLIDTVLKELGVIPNTQAMIDDPDLLKIPEVYSGKGQFWIAVNEDQVLGTVAIREIGNNQAKLNRMFVDAKYRGSGLGQKLFDTALNHAKSQRFNEIVLNTHLLMNRAHSFYEKNGFQKTGQTVDKYSYVLKL